MRFGMMVAAVAAVLGSASQAEADPISIIFESGSGAFTLTGGSTVTCPYYGPQSDCVTSAPFFNSVLPTPTFTIPTLDGTFNFSGYYGPNSNAGIYAVTGNVVFSNGSLISDGYDFNYSSSQIGNLTVRTTMATGTIRNALLTVINGNTVTTLAPVPEPATWAMLIVGFATLGTMLRSRRRQTSSFRSVMRA